MSRDADIRRYVMRRVYAMYYLRQISRPTPRFVALFGLAVGLVGSVSVANVISNVSHKTGSVVDFAQYVGYAVVGTEVSVQVMLLGIAALVAWFVVDSAKSLQLSVFKPRELAQ